MIGSLRGTVVDVNPAGELTVEVGGVGYRLSVTPGLLASTNRGAELFVWVSQQTKDDVAQLFGFASSEERRTFELLLAAHRVGPALALTVLANLSPEGLRQAVLTDDHRLLTAVPGVGKTTAQRIIIDLKNRIGADDIAAETAGGAGAALRPATALDEVRAGLAEMGFSPDEVAAALREVADEVEATSTTGDQVAQLMRLALQSLNRHARR